MSSRPVVKKPSVVVSRVINIGGNPLSERPMGERERLIKEVRFLLGEATVALSYAGNFDLKKFLEGITLVKESRSDEGFVIVSCGRLYKFYVEDIGRDSMPMSVDKRNRIRLEDGEQTYYIFPVSRS
jgi:hypothetical protein